mgnify:FL=1
MKLSTISIDGSEELALWTGRGLVPVKTINSVYGMVFPSELLDLIRSGSMDRFSRWYRSLDRDELEGFETIDPGEADFRPCYRHPPKIWGIGLNYRRHAADLEETAPEAEPASFMKPDTTIIGFGDTIKIPVQSHRTTAEAELGVVIGRECSDIREEDWLEYVAGFTPVLDMTAEDILRRNPRYLTRAKSFDTFFSFGPQLITCDELDNIEEIRVRTVINGAVHAENLIANMVHSPSRLVSFHSRVMTLLPGDIISTGTPGAVPLKEGDTVEAVIDGFEPLVNRVTDLKSGL